MSAFSLRELMTLAGQRMRADLDERLVAHPGEKGVGREQIVRQFLASYLPKRFEISTGFAFDSSCQVSRQLDIIIADALTAPRFETAGGTRFYPCESVVAVVQVRSSVTSSGEFRDALSNLESAKELDRSANGRAFDSRRGEVIDNRNDYLHQIFTALIVTGRALKGERAREELLSYLHDRPAHLWPNVIIALDRYLLTYRCDDGICANAMHARGISLQKASKDQDILMRFYLILGGAIEVARVSGLPYWEYLSQLGGWSADTMYSATDSPPPYLSSILGR